MRASTVPSPCEARLLKQHLLSECLFFGLPALADYLRGHISPHDMRPEDREIRALERHACGLFDLYQADTCRLRDPIEIAATLLPSTVPRATVKGGLGDFQRRLSEWTDGLSERLRDVDDVVFAGGGLHGSSLRLSARGRRHFLHGRARACARGPGADLHVGGDAAATTIRAKGAHPRDAQQACGHAVPGRARMLRTFAHPNCTLLLQVGVRSSEGLRRG